MKCAQLNKLWSRRPPQVSELTSSKGKKRVRGVDEEDKGKGGEEDDGGEGYGREGRREKRSRVKRQVTPSDRNLRSRRPVKVKFAYGPDNTIHHQEEAHHRDVAHSVSTVSRPIWDQRGSKFGIALWVYGSLLKRVRTGQEGLVSKGSLNQEVFLLVTQLKLV
ncbi:hypothetical protein EV426DRAFT_572198 [Tirmania nivea]|nr:hypothetical protein EV426DRAFT_572198 [Tirmania nivea]